jgi:RimJ/RimL family protein N-acetyltransferase
VICGLPQNKDELFYMFPKATFPLSYQQLKKAMDERSDSTVVLVQGEIAGFANFYVCQPGIKCSIGNVIVGPGFRGRGVATYLIKTMTQMAFDKHRARVVQISCFNANVAGLLLYSKLGFVPYEIEARKDGAGHRVALVHMKMNNRHARLS